MAADIRVDSMISALEANGVLWMPSAVRGQVEDIDRRAKYGDESGWRGDPSFCVCLNTQTVPPQWEIWGIDARGGEYKAASSTDLDIRLIHQLRDGDPRKHDVFDEVMAHNAKLHADREAARKDRLAEVGEKLQWAIRRDFRDELGTGARDVYPVPAMPGER